MRRYFGKANADTFVNAQKAEHIALCEIVEHYFYGTADSIVVEK